MTLFTSPLLGRIKDIFLALLPLEKASTMTYTYCDLKHPDREVWEEATEPVKTSHHHKVASGRAHCVATGEPRDKAMDEK